MDLKWILVLPLGGRPFTIFTYFVFLLLLFLLLFFFLFCASTLNVSLSTYLYKIMFCYLYIKINYQLKRERVICVKKMLKNEVFFKKKLLILCYETVAFHSLPFRSPFNFSMNLMWWAHVSFLRGVGFYFHLAKPEQTF